MAPPAARAALPGDARLFQGFLPPVRDQLARRMDGHDVIVSIGAPIFTYHVHTEGPYLPEGARLFHLDCDPAQTAWAPVGTSVLTTIRAGVTALLEMVEKADRPLPEARVRPRPAPPTHPLQPALVIDTLPELI